jgi:serine/threonine protein kinase
MPLAQGTRLGPYEIQTLLGAGGMGEVYSALDSRLRRTVAIKVLQRDAFRGADAEQRFLQEARAASALNHPHIVTLHDIDRDGDTDFLVMEYVRGTALSRAIPENGLPLPISSSTARRSRVPWAPHTPRVSSTAISSLRT